jgi:oligopeptide/dipeptide ABC transporter ATP-binding protein
VQSQYLRLLKDVQRDTGAALLFVTHDFGVVSRVCDRVAVMYAGRIVETGPVADVFERPSHPYTKGLLRSVVGRSHGDRRLYSIVGQPPSLDAPATGCSFAPRCEHVTERCHAEPPPEVTVTEVQTVRCWLAGSERG